MGRFAFCSRLGRRISLIILEIYLLAKDTMRLKLAKNSP
jgi:hypothetical protein